MTSEPVFEAVPQVGAMSDYTIYTKPACTQCDQTKAYFDRKGITYTSVDITEVPAALVYIKEELGYPRVPVVVSNLDDQNHWAGMRRDKLVQAHLHRVQA